MRKRLTRAFLWCSVTLWGVALGAKIFDLLVLARAWGGNVPTSLMFYPYGKDWPIDPGNFFQPLSAFLLLAIVGALWSGWKTMRRYRLYLELSVGAFALIWLATPTLFWPLINAIYQVAHHRVAIADVEALAMVRRWFFYDSIRIIVIAAGFFSAVRAISIPYAESIATSSSSN
jgi:hypothetical protein